jgi:hypothetical protein
VRLTGHVARMRNAYKISVAKLERKNSRGRHRRRWEGIVKGDLSEIGWEIVGYIHLAQNRDRWWAFIKTVMNLRVS